MKGHPEIALLLLCVVGCTTVPDRVPEREPLKPLLPGVKTHPYLQLFERAREQSNRALNASYVDEWSIMVEFGGGLTETARLFPMATEVPPHQRASLQTRSQELEKAAEAFQQASKNKDATEAHRALDLVRSCIRELRPIE